MGDRLGDQQDLEWIRRTANQDSAALGLLYDRYNRLVFSLVLRIVGNREDAEDVMVEVFWQVWQQASRFDESRGKPVAWLLTIARTRAIDRLRSSGSRQTVPIDSISTKSSLVSNFTSTGEADPFVLADTRQAVNDALQTLSEQQRAPLELAYFQGMSHTEIAAALGQPLGTIKDRIRNGMMHLRKRLKPYL